MQDRTSAVSIKVLLQRMAGPYIGERLVRQRTGLVNALRGHLAEFGAIAPQGLRNVGKLIAIVRDEDDARLPDLARQVLQVLAAQIEQLEAAVAAWEWSGRAPWRPRH